VSSKRALVTGASGSIGAAIAERLLADGFGVVGTYRVPKERVERLSDAGVEMICVDLVLNGISSLGDLHIDCLVNCAGINPVSTQVVDVGADAWRMTLEINLTVPFLLSQAFIPGMLSRGWGRIVNVGSIYSKVGSVLNSAYNVSKHGLSGLTKSIAQEYGRHGITCNEVLPGAVYSDLIQDIAKRKAAATGASPEAYLVSIEQSIPTGRLAYPSDVAGAVSYLCSPDADYLNGTSLIVDGGGTC
jgi:3-hydroxybutyrate dehydrogenase